uniref:G_PROTEIN_RECEP_F1_2 domain-containing protein n=1 Tax=Panagrellus redivivus TaxID=6233 RepID=A0A7E4WAK8_PANRE
MASTSMATTTTELPYCVVSDAQIVLLWPTIDLFGINIYVGIVCISAVVLNFVVLMSTKKFRRQYSVVIVLCVAEMFAELGIILEATTRRPLFLDAIAAKRAEKMSSRQCLQPWVLSQTIGDFWCPSLEFLMGLERMCAVTFPHFFRRIFVPNNIKIILFVSLVAALFVITPTAITIIYPTDNVRWSCGRKAAYGSNFGLVDYSYNVIGFSLAFTFNLIAMFNATSIKHTKQSALNLTKLKCYTAISFLSTLLVSVPNLFSILNVFTTVSSLLMTPAPILACANGAIQFFVYLTLNVEYRQRFIDLVTFNRMKVVRVKPLLSFRQASTSTFRASVFH